MSPANSSRTSPNRCRRNSNGTRVTNEALSGQYWEDQFFLFPLPKTAPSPCGFRMNCTVCSPLVSLTVIRALLCLSWEPPLSASLKFAAFCFIYHPDLYYCKPSMATTTAITVSQGLLLVLSIPNEQHLESHTHSGFSQSNSIIQEMNADEPIYLPCRPLLLILWLSST